METNNQDKRLAVLIDADNISHHYVKGMMQEIARYGTPTIKRIYGDWTKPNLGGWKSILLDYAISPIQQFNYTTGKNATDSAMTIDAMDILYTENVDAFCLVSSDSDFTKLATRIRESGKTVYGIGEQKTPTPFIAACDRFIFLEILHEDDEDEQDSQETENKKKTNKSAKNGTTKPTSKKRALQNINRKTTRLISQSIKDVEDENGWAYLADVGNLIVKKQPSFDARNYGFSKLSHMFETMDEFEIDVRDSGTGSSNYKHYYVRVKSNKRKRTTHF
ncbi:MAG: NYN domain-containing protein [Clostridiaceae bacterium]|nr:NYN domain-containing protein [Clostridiaceae bacterium]